MIYADGDRIGFSGRAATVPHDHDRSGAPPVSPATIAFGGRPVPSLGPSVPERSRTVPQKA